MVQVQFFRVQEFNNKLTSKNTVAILTFSKLMLNDCVKRGLEDFTDSIVEWSCRIFEKHIVDFETTVDWKAVLAHLERDSTEKPDEENSSNIIFVKCLLVITVGCLLIGVVVRYILRFENENLELKKRKFIY